MIKYDLALIVPLYDMGKEFPAMEYQGFAVLKGYLQARGYQVDVIDAFAEYMTYEELIGRVLENKYRWIGFTAMSSQYVDKAARIYREISKQERFSGVFLGGSYATVHGSQLIKQYDCFDMIVAGDGEETIREILDCKTAGEIKKIKGIIYKDSGKIYENPIRTALTEKELNMAPAPIHMNLEKILQNEGSVQIVTSRGCYGNCVFCGVSSYMKKIQCDQWRALSSERVVREIEYLVNRYSLDAIDIADDNFMGEGKRGQERAKEIARKLIEKNIKIKFSIYSRVNDFDEETFIMLKKAGMQNVFFGIEFGVQSILDFYHKGIRVEDSIRVMEKCRELGIKVMPGFIMFEPYMTIAQLKDNLEFYYKYCDFKLYRLMTRLEVFKYSEIYYLLTRDKEINIDQESEFSEVFGDVCDYHFKDMKIEHIYNSFKENLPQITPSKSYQYIVHTKSVGKDNLISIWITKIYQILLEYIEAVENNEKQFDLGDRLHEFDNDFAKQLAEGKYCEESLTICGGKHAAKYE